jgi:type II secretory pathway component PulF
MSNIETLATRIAKAMIKGDEAIAKANESTLDKVCDEVIKAARSSITKVDLKPLRAGIVSQYVEAGNAEASANTQASQVMRLVKVAANLDKKLSEYHDINTVEDGIATLEMVASAASSTSLKTCYEALGIPKDEEVASDDEVAAESESSEPLAKDAPEIQHLFSEFLQKAFDNGHTKMEIAQYLAQVSIDMHRDAS